MTINSLFCSERTKRLYPELQADQDFLHQMLGIWSSKLEQLKVYKYRNRLVGITVTNWKIPCNLDEDG